MVCDTKRGDCASITPVLPIKARMTAKLPQSKDFFPRVSNSVGGGVDGRGREFVGIESAPFGGVRDSGAVLVRRMASSISGRVRPFPSRKAI